MFRRAFLSLLLLAPAFNAAGMDADRQMANSLLAISQSRMPEALTAVDLLTQGNTPVIIAEQVEWVAHDVLDARRNDLSAAMDQWRQDWESRDVSRLLNHYGTSFRAGTQTLPAFAVSKHKVNAAKSWIKVGLDNVSLMLYPQGAGRGSKDAKASSTTHYPERPDFALVSFVQNYQSNKLSDRTVKRQFWSRENGRWKIIHETSL